MIPERKKKKLKKKFSILVLHVKGNGYSIDFVHNIPEEDPMMMCYVKDELWFE